MDAASRRRRMSKAWQVFGDIRESRVSRHFSKLKSSQRTSIMSCFSYCRNPIRQIAPNAIFAVVNRSLCGYRVVTSFSGAN